MSGVYERLRSKTTTQFIINAIELQIELAHYCTKEKFVPKKYRLMLGIPIINKVNEMVDNITFANSIFANDEAKFAKRQEYQTKAIANCFQLQNLIIALEKTIDKVTIESLNKIIDLLCIELSLLQSWKKSDKIINKKASC